MNNQRKTRRLNIRLTDDEWLIINELANRTGMTISAFILTTILKGKITIYEIDTQAILLPLLGLQRHYNTIRHWMITRNYKNPILTVEYEQELKDLWQLLAQAAGKGSSSAAGSIKYVQYEKGTTNTRIIFSDGINCSPYYKDAIHDFELIRDTFQKYGGREAHHMVLAFSPAEETKFTPKELFQKSIEITKKIFPDHQIWLGMHNDTEHLHVHIVINSVNLETGNKLQIAGRKGMHNIMEKVQLKAHELGLDTTLSIGRKQYEQGHVVTHNIIEHKLIEHGKSWKADIAEKVYTALEHANI